MSMKLPLFRGQHDQWHQWRNKVLAVFGGYDLIGAITTPRPPDAPVAPAPGGAGGGAGGAGGGTGGGGAALVAALAGPPVRTPSERWDLKNAKEWWHRRRSGDRSQRIEEHKNAEKHRGEFRPGMRYHGHMNFLGAAAKLKRLGAVPFKKPMMRCPMRGAEGREIEYGPGKGPGPVVGVVMQDAYPKDWVPGGVIPATSPVKEAIIGPEECEQGYGRCKSRCLGNQDYQNRRAI
jgi:hypothetical protein